MEGGCPQAKNYALTCSGRVRKTWSWKGKAKWPLVGSGKDVLAIFAKCQQDEQGHRPEGGHVWNSREMQVVRKYIEGKTHITTKELKEAFQDAGVQRRCLDHQVHDFVKLFNSANKAHPPRDALPIEQYQQRVQLWIEGQSAPKNARIDELLI